MTQKSDLIRCEQRVRRQLQEEGLDRSQREGQGHQQAPAPGFTEHDLHQIPEAVNRGPAQLIGFAFGRRALQPSGNGGRDVTDKDGLKARMSAADERKHRRNSRQRGEFVEELIFRPEHDGWSENDGARESRPDAFLAFRLGLGIVEIRLAVGADGGDIDQSPDAQLCRGFGDVAGADGMNGLETLTARKQDAGEIDGGLGALERQRHLVRIGNVAFDETDLANLAEGAQEKGAIGVPAGAIDAPAGLGQRPDRVASQKARTAKDRDLFCLHREEESG